MPAKKPRITLHIGVGSRPVVRAWAGRERYLALDLDEKGLRNWIKEWDKARGYGTNSTKALILAYRHGTKRGFDALKKMRENNPRVLASQGGVIPPHSLPLRNASVREVFAQNIFNAGLHPDVLKKMLNEFGRVLQPGGRLVIVHDVGDMSIPPSLRIHNDYLEGPHADLGEQLFNPRPHLTERMRKRFNLSADARVLTLVKKPTRP